MKQTLARVALLVQDYDEALAFFVDTLDFTLVEDTPLPEEGKRWVVVAPRGSTESALLLARAGAPEQVEQIGRQAGGRVAFFLYTDDFEREYARMLARGVRFVRPPRSERYGRVAVFLDLYGNKWDLIEPR